MKNIMVVLLSLILLIAFLSGCGNQSVDTGDAVGEPSQDAQVDPADAKAEPSENIKEEEAPPETGWEFGSPENHGVDSGILSSLHDTLEDTEIYSVVIAKDGVIVDEYYKDGYDETSAFRLHSCSKSFTGALMGIAINKGFIDDVDIKLTDFFPQLIDSDKKDITIRHLLEATSGIAWYEWGGNHTSFGQFVGSDNWVDYVLEQPMMYTPGSTFNYTTGGSHILAAIIQNATGKTLYDFGVEYLFGPIGMNSVTWSADDQGVTDGGNGISMNTRDAAKFGQLYLNGGKWDDKQVIPAEWVELSTTPQSTGAGNSGRYGYQWWIRAFEGYDTYYAMGHAGQFIFVVPELNLVTVITSRYPENTYAPWPYFTDYILAACDS